LSVHKSEWNLSFKHDWDWAPADHEIKERLGRQRGDKEEKQLGVGLWFSQILKEERQNW